MAGVESEGGRGMEGKGGGRSTEAERGGGQSDQSKGPEEAVGSEFVNLFDIC